MATITVYLNIVGGHVSGRRNRVGLTNTYKVHPAHPRVCQACHLYRFISTVMRPVSVMLKIIGGMSYESHVFYTDFLIMRIFVDRPTPTRINFVHYRFFKSDYIPAFCHNLVEVLHLHTYIYNILHCWLGCIGRQLVAYQFRVIVL